MTTKYLTKPEKSIKQLPNGGVARQITSEEAVAYKAKHVYVFTTAVVDDADIPEVKDTPECARLEKMAADHQPPAAWLEGDEEDLF